MIHPQYRTNTTYITIYDLTNISYEYYDLRSNDSATTSYEYYVYWSIQAYEYYEY